MRPFDAMATAWVNIIFPNQPESTAKHHNKSVLSLL
jgi:hypothetical protein